MLGFKKPELPQAKSKLLYSADVPMSQSSIYWHIRVVIRVGIRKLEFADIFGSLINTSPNLPTSQSFGNLSKVYPIISRQPQKARTYVQVFECLNIFLFVGTSEWSLSRAQQTARSDLHPNLTPVIKTILTPILQNLF